MDMELCFTHTLLMSFCHGVSSSGALSTTAEIILGLHAGRAHAELDSLASPTRSQETDTSLTRTAAIRAKYKTNCACAPASAAIEDIFRGAASGRGKWTSTPDLLPMKFAPDRHDALYAFSMIAGG